MGLTITIRLDPRQLECFVSNGVSDLPRVQQAWTAGVTRTIQKAGFTVAVQTGAGFDAYRDWDLTIDGHTIKARTPLSEALNYSGLAVAILGDCTCSDNPCLCSERGRDTLTRLLPVIVSSAELAVESGLECGEADAYDVGCGPLAGGADDGNL
jgi:hypothetical protein